MTLLSVRIQQYDKATLLRHPMPSLYHAKASDRRPEISRQASYFLHNTLALHNIYKIIIGWYQNVVEIVRNGDPLADTKEHSRPSKIWQSSEQVLLFNVDNTGIKNVYQFVKRI